MTERPPDAITAFVADEVRKALESAALHQPNDRATLRHCEAVVMETLDNFFDGLDREEHIDVVVTELPDRALSFDFRSRTPLGAWALREMAALMNEP